MATNIAPGVYTKVVDLSSYIQETPSTIGLVISLTKRGEDNKMKFVASRGDLINEFGEPNINTFGRLGQGHYIADNFINAGGSLYFMRPMPDDATFANIRLDSVLADTDSTASIQLTYVSSLNSMAELTTNLGQQGDISPIGFFRPIGRGVDYNKIGIRLSMNSNPMYEGLYILDIYEKQSDGNDQIIESFEISFDPEAKDSTGQSVFIGTILANFSKLLRFEMKLASGDFTSGFYQAVKTYDQEQGNVTVNINDGTALISDSKQDFDDWKTVLLTGNANYMIIAKDGRGHKIYGWLGDAVGVDSESIKVYDQRDLSVASQSWLGDTVSFDVDSFITYQIKKVYVDLSSPFISFDPVPLRRGSDGSLFDNTGRIDEDVAIQLLSQAYAGIIDDNVLDKENFYFSVVLDGGYPTDVKTQIVSLANTRRDCIAFIDNGDNATHNLAMYSRNTYHAYNSQFVAIYEGYNKVYDPFTGSDIWVSPIYHVAYLLPRNDSVRDVWWAIAGFTRGVPDGIKELRYNPKEAQRDQQYLKQLNPIVKFSQGYAVYGNLTSQAKPSILQNINVMRLYVYASRAIKLFCEFFIYEQNDEITWSGVRGEIISFLERLRYGRGLRTYNVEVGADTYELRRKKFHVNVTMFPITPVEQIEITFNMKN